MNRDERMNANMQALIEILMATDKPMSIYDVRQKTVLKQINTDATVRNYLRKLPENLDEDHELIVRQHGRKYGYQIIDKRDRYPITKTESGYPDPTAAKALEAVMHSESKTEYVPGSIWPVRIGWKKTVWFLVISCDSDSEGRLLYGFETHNERHAKMKGIDLTDERVVKVSQTLYADTRILFTRREQYVDGEKIGDISDSDLCVVQGMLKQRLHFDTQTEKPKDEKVKRDTDIYALKSKIRKLEARLAEKEKRTTLEELKEENAILRGKVQAYECIFKQLPADMQYEAADNAEKDYIAKTVLRKLARTNSDDGRKLACAILFGNKGGKMRDSTRVKDPVFESMKKWGKEHPDVNAQIEYDPVLMKIRFRMTWLQNSKLSTEKEVDFHTYDVCEGSDQATEKFTCDVLDSMYKEGGYGHE